MCSVVGYIGKNKSRDTVLDGLTRLEYRGYDSAGFACIDSETKHLVVAKKIGQLSNLKQSLKNQSSDGFLSLGHTRWATHGAATEQNAHPHVDCTSSLAVVHNGIIENHTSLKKILEHEDHAFKTETDSEVLAHLFEQYTIDEKMPPLQAMQKMVEQLEGAYAFCIISEHYPDSLFIARKGSPLCIGLGEGEMFVGSDPLAFTDKTNRVLFLPEKSYALVHKDGYALYDFSGNVLSVQSQIVDTSWIAGEKGDHEHYMLKEIYEQKHAIDKTVRFFQSIHTTIFDYLGITQEELQNLESITFLGCGTSAHAGKLAQFFFEQKAGIQTRCELASEFRHKTFFKQKNHLYIAISQSGETADTLEAIRLVQEHGQATLALTNVASSTLVRECDGFLLTQAGPEIAVASTKAFSTQLAALYWLAHCVAYHKKSISHKQFQESETELFTTAEILENVIEQYKHEIMMDCAPFYKKYKEFIFIGRHNSFPFAEEAALKLKEISYVFAQAYPAGELKHGPLALVDEFLPVVIFSHPDPVIYQKLLSNAQEIKARKGHIIVFALEHQKELLSLAHRAFIIPAVPSLLFPLAMTGIMQFFCYALAKVSGHAIDKPRNLAKSVTVE